MRNTLIGKILLLHKIMAIIQTPQVGNQSERVQRKLYEYMPVILTYM